MKKMTANILPLAALLLGCVCVPTMSYAQGAGDKAVTADETAVELIIEDAQSAGSAEARRAAYKQRFNPLLFTYWEYIEVKEAIARRGQVDVSDVPVEDTVDDFVFEPEDVVNAAPVVKVKPPPEERDITLGGILYTSPQDWTIWLNGVRVTPNSRPSEVLSLSVYKDYIELKWLDDYSDQIVLIRLRPYQRFNLDTRMFLSGAAR